MALEKTIRLITRFGVQLEEVKHFIYALEGFNRILQAEEDSGPYPQLMVQRAPNLSDMLIHSESTKQMSYNWLLSYPRTSGMFSCNHCQICPYVDCIFVNTSDMKTFKIHSLIKCSTTRVLYMITCPWSKKYVGKTK